MTSTHKVLKQGTAELHDAVDAAFGRLDLSNPDHYRAFLLAHARIVPPLESALGAWETALPDWAGRKRGDALRSDIKALDAAHGQQAELPVPELNSAERAYGAAYVLEGSRLGGKLLAKSLPENAPRSYLDAAQPKGGWRKFLQSLNGFVYTASQQESALASARDVFILFRTAANDVLE